MNKVYQKVADEARELYIKIEKLREFLQSSKFHNLSDHHKSLLVIQESIMNAYFETLNERINLFNNKEE